MRTIADRAGISEDVIYRHFESKDQLPTKAVVEPLLGLVLFGDPKVARLFCREDFAAAMDRLAQAWTEVQARHGARSELADVSAQAVMGTASPWSPLTPRETSTTRCSPQRQSARPRGSCRPSGATRSLTPRIGGRQDTSGRSLRRPVRQEAWCGARDDRWARVPGVTTSGLELFAQLQQAFAASDPAALGALLHADFEIEQPASLPHGGRHRGLAGMAEMSRTFADHWDRSIGSPVVRDAGDVVVQVTTQTWTAKATGRSATVDVVELVSFAGDRIREIRVFQQDTHALLTTLATTDRRQETT